jgi:hypothetical protein
MPSDGDHSEASRHGAAADERPRRFAPGHWEGNIAMKRQSIALAAALFVAAAGVAFAPSFAFAKDDHATQRDTPIPEVKRTSQQPLDAKKKGGSDPVEQHDQKPAQKVDPGNASPRTK